MDKCIYKGVDIFNPLAGKMKYFVDAFTTIYGEQYRGVIEKRLKNAEYYFLGGKFSNIILKYQELEKEEIKNLEKTPNISPSLIKIKKKDIHDRYQFIIDVFTKTQKQMDIITFKYSNAVDSLIYLQINEIRKKNKLPVLTKQQAQKYIPTYLDLLSVTRTDFSRKKTLYSDKKKQDFIDLFKAVGFEEKNFDAYTKNKSCLNMMYNYKLVNDINVLHQAKNEELNKINFCVAELNYQIKNLDIYGNHGEYEHIGSQFIQNKTSNSAFVVNCVTSKSEFKSLCFCKNALDLTIEDLVHEMGHIIDAFVVESSQSGYYYKNGFELNFNGFTYDSYKKSIVPEAGEKGYRHCEMFNEMVNEFICLKVAKELKKTGKQFTFASRENSGKVKYAFGFEVFDNFLEKYQDKLIELKMKVDKNEGAYEFFGDENFKQLTTIAKEYIEKRTELNLRCCYGYKDAYGEIERLKAKTKAEVEILEQKIEKHIAKNEAKKQREAKELAEKAQTNEKEKTANSSNDKGSIVDANNDSRRPYVKPKIIVNFEKLFNKIKTSIEKDSTNKDKNLESAEKNEFEK